MVVGTGSPSSYHMRRPRASMRRRPGAGHSAAGGSVAQVERLASEGRALGAYVQHGSGRGSVRNRTGAMGTTLAPLSVLTPLEQPSQKMDAPLVAVPDSAGVEPAGGQRRRWQAVAGG